MRRPGFAITIRRLMIAVAILALVLGGIRYGFHLKARRSYFLREAARHAGAAKWFQRWIEAHPAFVADLKAHGYRGDIERDFSTPKMNAAFRDRHRLLEQKYRRAAARPWLAVDPDLPAPDEGVYFPLPDDQEDVRVW